MTDASISAAIDELDDDWSYYMTVDNYEAYQKSMNNQYEGIGITYSRTEDDNYIQVETVTKGSPAEEAGLELGMIISEIDGEEVSDIEDESIRELILSKLGDSVFLTVLTENDDNLVIEVECKEYYANPVSYELYDENIGYINLSNFDSGSAGEVITAIEDLLEQGAQSFVFDVRNNGGGLVTEMLEILDYILPEGELFITADKNGNEKIEYSDDSCLDMPMVVLVNASSYSAAEYFGAILMESGVAEVVGEHTTGKGRSQITKELSDGSAVHISSKTYYTPDRIDLSEIGGFEPDYVVEQSDDIDNQLEKALELLK